MLTAFMVATNSMTTNARMCNVTGNESEVATHYKVLMYTVTASKKWKMWYVDISILWFRKPPHSWTEGNNATLQHVHTGRSEPIGLMANLIIWSPFSAPFLSYRILCFSQLRQLLLCRYHLIMSDKIGHSSYSYTLWYARLRDVSHGWGWKIVEL